MSATTSADHRLITESAVSTSWRRTRQSVRVPRRQDSTDDLLRQYRQALVEMDGNRVERGGDHRRWNRLVNQMQALHLRLRETPEGRDGITDLAMDDNLTVRGWSAVNALAWDPQRARPVLEEEAANDVGLHGFEAMVALQEFDAGRLNTAWEPKGSRRS